MLPTIATIFFMLNWLLDRNKQETHWIRFFASLKPDWEGVFIWGMLEAMTVLSLVFQLRNQRFIA